MICFSKAACFISKSVSVIYLYKHFGKIHFVFCIVTYEPDSFTFMCV